MEKDSYQTIVFTRLGAGTGQTAISIDPQTAIGFNDFNLAFGGTGMYSSGSITAYKDKEGKVSFSGQVLYTFYDRFDWNLDDKRGGIEKLGLGIGNNFEMENLKHIGAKDFYSRAYFMTELTSSDGSFDCGPYIDVKGSNNPEPDQGYAIPAGTPITYDGRK